MRRRFDHVIYPIPLLVSSPGWIRVKRHLFTTKQCDDLVSLADERGYHRARNKRIKRDLHICYLNLDDAPWAYEQMVYTFAAENIWGFVLTAMVEPMRILKYTQGGCNREHFDFDYRTDDQSKITAIVPLVGRSTWRGGRLSVARATSMPALDKGDCVLFPSFAPHAVSPVTKGTRIVLSAWAAGPRLV